MAKGAAIKFISYETTVPKLLEILKLPGELRKYDKIVLKPTFINGIDKFTPKEFTEEVLKFCLKHKNPVAEVFIAEGADGYNTEELFSSLGYKTLAEHYNIGLIDLNKVETEEIISDNFLKFQSIEFPKILKDSFVISLSKLAEHEETDIIGSVSSMLGAFPSSHYSGFFSSGKNKIRKWHIKYSIHDINMCKMPNFAIVDASEKGSILAGLPLEIDKQCARLLNKDWKMIPHLRLLDEEFADEKEDKNQVNLAN